MDLRFNTYIADIAAEKSPGAGGEEICVDMLRAMILAIEPVVGILLR